MVISNAIAPSLPAEKSFDCSHKGKFAFDLTLPPCFLVKTRKGAFCYKTISSSPPTSVHVIGQLCPPV